MPISALAAQASGSFLALGPAWLDPANLINTFVTWLGPWALVGVCAVVFAETGLMIGFFLPGDSLLFTLGVFLGMGKVPTPIWVACLAIACSAVIGDQTGYWIGRKLGPRVFNKPDSRLFKREYVDRTYAFFARYGGRTIVIAQYVPIVRTFCPVVAGVGKMNYRHFIAFNLVAAFTWGILIPLAGVWLGQSFPFVEENIDLIIVGIVLASVTPMIVEYLRHRRRKRQADQAEQPAQTQTPQPAQAEQVEAPSATDE
ncbi:MAG: VTT domain-containing protein [Bifidobacteriaceae bacterium]|jgi:membrane-associated protein|nr:VTT domain-containing protein [Bifidobacteriaceae bacterium]